MSWIKSFFGIKPAGYTEADLQDICMSLRNKLLKLGPAAGPTEEKKLDLNVSLPLQDALVESNDFILIYTEYFKAGWRLDFNPVPDKNIVELVINYQPLPVCEK